MIFFNRRWVVDARVLAQYNTSSHVLVMMVVDQ